MAIKTKANLIKTLLEELVFFENFGIIGAWLIGSSSIAIFSVSGCSFFVPRSDILLLSFPAFDSLSFLMSFFIVLMSSLLRNSIFSSPRPLSSSISFFIVSSWVTVLSIKPISCSFSIVPISGAVSCLMFCSSFISISSLGSSSFFSATGFFSTSCASFASLIS